MRKDKETLRAEIAEADRAAAEKEAEYKRALSEGLPAGQLQAELQRLQRKANVIRSFSNLEMVVIDREGIVREALEEQTRTLQEMKDAAKNGHIRE